MSFEIAVVIPAFNAEKFVGKAVKSALAQPEVAEVLVIEDGSKDKTLKILKNMFKLEPRLRIFSHPHGRNRGRSASRNLGIKNAKSDFIAFLDADDYYLEDRFKNDKLLFELNPDIDGIYNAIGVHFYREPENENEVERLELTTLKFPIPPEELFYHKWPRGSAGNFSGDGLTVKKSIFDKVGLFNENLKVAEDSELWIKMSLKAKLVAGILDKPVSIRGVHHSNVFQKTGKGIYLRNKYLMYESLAVWGGKENLQLDILSFFRKENFKLFSLLGELDNRKIPDRENIIFLIKNLKKHSYISTFYFILFLFIYKPFGVGYFIRKRLIVNLKNSYFIN